MWKRKFSIFRKPPAFRWVGWKRQKRGEITKSAQPGSCKAEQELPPAQLNLPATTHMATPPQKPQWFKKTFCSPRNQRHLPCAPRGGGCLGTRTKEAFCPRNEATINLLPSLPLLGGPHFLLIQWAQHQQTPFKTFATLRQELWQLLWGAHNCRMEVIYGQHWQLSGLLAMIQASCVRDRLRSWRGSGRGPVIYPSSGFHLSVS